MNAWSPAVPERGTSSLTERATAILRDEIAHGALANIAAATREWPARRRDLIDPESTRRLAAGFGGLLDAVLDLLAPPSGSTAASSTSPSPPPRRWAASSLSSPPPPPDTAIGHAPERGRQTIEPLPVLRARRSAPPGGAVEIHTALRNDGATPVDVGFVWSDLVADSDGRIQAGCLRLLPDRVRIPPGASVDLAITLEVPADARPGLYQALLQATELAGLCALLSFPVGHIG